jgi:hypothetical protein
LRQSYVDAVLEEEVSMSEMTVNGDEDDGERGAKFDGLIITVTVEQNLK